MEADFLMDIFKEFDIRLVKKVVSEFNSLEKAYNHLREFNSLRDQFEADSDDSEEEKVDFDWSASEELRYEGDSIREVVIDKYIDFIGENFSG